ncbi:tyrosine-type recombinase/integrase [Roseobacter sp. HKCCD5988]|uniref:tyrosine-type recombinase/integrase n=1 Tax=Roseobacter sp. HKCCD5988 TaxID=3120338 RepID=UPI0030EF6AD7
MIAESNKSYDWLGALELLKGAYAPSTIDAYYRDFCVFVQWCDLSGVKPLPCGVADVVAFLDDQSETKAATTVRRYAVSIGKIHRLLNFDDPTKSELLRLALRRAQRAAIAPQRQSIGLTREDVNAIVAKRHRSLRHLRDAAMISVGFDGLMRRSEIVSLRMSDVEWNGSETARVIVRRSKTDQLARGRVVWPTDNSNRVLKDWMELRDSTQYLFGPVYGDLMIDRLLNPVSVQRAIKRCLREIGYDEYHCYTGHALRVGAAQELLRMGRDTAGIMRAGGWKSVSTLARYLERAEHSVWSGQNC